MRPLAALLLSLVFSTGSQATPQAAGATPVARAELMRQCAEEWRTTKHMSQGAGVKYQRHMSDCLKRKAALAPAQAH